MLPRAAGAAFVSEEYLFDVAWGGRRALVFVEAAAEDVAPAAIGGARAGDSVAAGGVAADEAAGGGVAADGVAADDGAAIRQAAVTVLSAGGRDLTPAWDSIVRAARALPGAPLILDGELVPPARWSAASHPLHAPVYVVHDLLALEGRLVLGEPLARRRERLQATLAGNAGAGSDGPILVAPPVEADGIGLLRAVAAYGLRGIVAKRRDSPYLPGVRSSLWQAIPAAAAPTAGVPADRVPGDAGSARDAAATRRRALTLLLRLPLEPGPD